MMFQIELDSQPKKFLKKCDKGIRERIFNELESLKKDPLPRGAIKIVGRKEKTYRIRLGKYRILYSIFHESNQILVSKIDKRPKIY